jgi:hypothetical protein
VQSISKKFPPRSGPILVHPKICFFTVNEAVVGSGGPGGVGGIGGIGFSAASIIVLLLLLIQKNL